MRSRIRVVVQEAASKGSQCPSLAETVPCNTDACPADCKVSGWSAWTKCTSACGGGRKSRTRTVLAAPDAYGVQCPPRSAVQNCNSHACAVDCKMSSWTQWGACSKSCGVSYKFQQHQIERMSEYGGKRCGSLIASKKCAVPACPLDCQLEGRGTWGVCSERCGGGVQTRALFVKQFPVGTGMACPPRNLAGAWTDKQACNTQACPIERIEDHFQFLDTFTWGGWSPCSKACGGGISSRTQQRTVLPPFGGKACGANTETKSCNQQNCAVDCLMGAWTGWSDCYQVVRPGRAVARPHRHQRRPAGRLRVPVSRRDAQRQPTGRAPLRQTCGAGAEQRSRNADLRPQRRPAVRRARRTARATCTPAPPTATTRGTGSCTPCLPGGVGYLPRPPGLQTKYYTLAPVGAGNNKFYDKISHHTHSPHLPSHPPPHCAPLAAPWSLY